MHYKATRRLLATDIVVFNHGQVTRTTPELTPSSSPNFHTIPTVELMSLNRFNVQWPRLNGVSSAALGRREPKGSMTLNTRLRGLTKPVEYSYTVKPDV
ncbi:hypothetical protein TNCV_4834491 [Trichonephila clavipes]|nr:hypothetical protein TNCV_4834491 [Trichonephila clavipes]